MNDAEPSFDSNSSRSQREQAEEIEPQPARNFRFEEVSHESGERYRRLFENHHAIMLLYDPETFNIVDANPAACQYYGYSHAQLTALKITDLNGMTLEQAAREYQRVQQTNVQPYFLRHRLATGDIRDVESYAGPSWSQRMERSSTLSVPPSTSANVARLSRKSASSTPNFKRVMPNWMHVRTRWRMTSRIRCT